MCFEVLGVDILIDSKGKPILIEVNHTPSFSTAEAPITKKKKAAERSQNENKTPEEKLSDLIDPKPEEKKIQKAEDVGVDWLVKSNVIYDTLKILGATTKMRKKLKTMRKRDMEKRVLTGVRQKYTKEERLELERKCAEERRQWMWRNLGNFDFVYEGGIGEDEKGLFGAGGYNFDGLDTIEERLEKKRLKKLEK